LLDHGRKMNYQPRPIDTSAVTLPVGIESLIEQLAEHNHDIWAKRRLAEGWAWGPERDDSGKKHPCLVSYADLPEQEKEYDRQTVVEALKAIIALGYRVEA
jgi:ryanodine receptor 2